MMTKSFVNRKNKLMVKAVFVVGYLSCADFNFVPRQDTSFFGMVQAK